ncbi:MAG: Smc, chromosome segregation ATPase, chromosome segregation protein [Candidatus Kaiserbacteria bacterium]|nr:Smc, chromosome segregation ATPase, chromosome segregation protein [Candidatus Kaiserbacteria bacterium]
MSNDMTLKSIEINGFKSFGKKSELIFNSAITSIVGPNGSGKSNVAEAFRFVLGEQSMKSMRSKRGEDLIWGGSPQLVRGNRAGVKVVFDNTRRLIDLDFTEVVIERIVYRDGQNEYLLNGSVVRLKDVIRLLAGANIGGSGYQIISQGEADRILNASPRERREMVEDALGLKLYQHKKLESERKLEETKQNVDKTKSLRRELAPHINFLRLQVEKIEKARELRDELSVRLNDYLAREHAYITQEDARLAQEEAHVKSQVAHTDTQIQTLTQNVTGIQEPHHQDQLQAFERDVQTARADVARLERELGRAEGALQVTRVTVEQSVGAPVVRTFAREVDSTIEEAERSNTIEEVRTVLGRARNHISHFLSGLSGAAPETSHESQQQVDALLHSLSGAQERERIAHEALEMERSRHVTIRESVNESERARITLESELRTLRGSLASIVQARVYMATLRSRFEDEVREGIALIGANIHAWDQIEIPDGALSEDRTVQDKRRRDMERLKIKIEEAGIGNSDEIIREFKQTKERDEFLARELIDLESSIESLLKIIADLEATIDEKFTEGLTHINTALHMFFTQLFSGGSASMTIEKPRRRHVERDLDADEVDTDTDSVEEEEVQPGLAISVSLPRKKVSGLEILSGGERALTSIALIFAMSQVNPPPFIILDETDAALDEANSKRYADMIRELGKRSQLIVITHNRATMAAANELYGVTMSQDGVSKLLSVKLEEATKVAK